MFKKMGVVTVGVAAGLMVAAPFASAHTSGHDSDHGSDRGSSGGVACNVTGGSAVAGDGVDGDAGLIGNIAAQVPVGGLNLANIACNDILNDNLSDNDVSVSVLGDGLALPL